jgi:bifunctional DNase/RNase
METSACSAPNCKNTIAVLALLISPQSKPLEIAVCKEHVGNLGLNFSYPNTDLLDENSIGQSFIECRLCAVTFEYDTSRYLFILKNDEDNRAFACVTGYVEACNLYGAVRAPSSSTPLTFQLFNNIIDTLSGEVIESVVDGFDRTANWYTFHVVLKTPEGLKKLKCKGSDAVGIAHFAGKPIKVDAALLAYD